MDEAQTPVLEEKRDALPMHGGTPQREDAEEERKGTGHRCAAWEPLTGTHVFRMISSRTKTAWADVLRDRLDGPEKDAEKRMVV
jgi:hypothetical protein